MPVGPSIFYPGMCGVCFFFLELTAASSVLVFMSTSGKGLQVTYPTISLHAISRADFGPSIYCQLDGTIDTEEEPTQDEEEVMQTRELRINVQNEETRKFL